MEMHFLAKNPFFVLEVSPSDKRSTIINNAEEKAFFLDGNACEDARTSLLNPAKRLAAEMDWFGQVDQRQSEYLQNCISQNTTINKNYFSGLAKLNASLYNFAISSYDDYYEIGYAIIDMDEQYASIDVTTLTADINQCHTKAGMLVVSEEDIIRELVKKRDQIRQIITEKVNGLTTDDYIDFVTMIAEKCIADDSFSNGLVISDLIDQYELRMQPSIEQTTEEINTHIGRIKKISNNEGVEANLAGFRRRMKTWARLMRPLQIRSNASGIPYRTSEDVCLEIRSLALYLHNDKNFSQTALHLVEEMVEEFSGIMNISAMFEEDARTLRRIITENKEAGQIIAEIKEIEAVIAKWKGPDTNKDNPYLLASNAITNEGVTSLVTKVRTINAHIKASSADPDMVIQLREHLCFTAREGAIYLHNERHQTAHALQIAKVLKEEFSDIESVRSKLAEDVRALEQQLLLMNSAQPRVQQSSDSKKAGTGCLMPIVILVVIMFLVGLCNSNSSSGNAGGSTVNNTTASSSNNSSSYNKPVATQPVEKRFTSSATVGSDVYADIVSIFPAIGIYTEGSSTYSYFVCECKTSSGSTVWVYMSTSKYRSNFDSNASTSIYTEYAEEVTFSSAKRIHGVAKRCDTIMSGLSSDTGSTLLISFESVD